MKYSIRPFTIKKPRTVKPLKFLLILLLLFMTYVAFNLKPITENDLFRYNLWSSEYAKKPLKDVISAASIDEKIIIAFFWIAGQSKNHLGIIPATTILIVYGITFWIICDASKMLQIKNSLLLQYTLLLLALFQFDSIASNVRNVLAFSITTLAVYLDLFKHKKNFLVLLLYLLPCGIHITSIILILARFMLFLYKKFRVLCIITVAFAPTVVKKIYSFNYLFANIPYLQKLVIKANHYFFEFYNTDWLNQVKNSGFEQTRKFVFFILFLVFLLLSCVIYKKVRLNQSDFFNIIAYVEILILLTLGSMHIPLPTYFRFSLPTLTLFSITFFVSHKYIFQNKLLKGLFYGGYINLLIFGFLSQAYHFYYNFTL